MLSHVYTMKHTSALSFVISLIVIFTACRKDPQPHNPVEPLVTDIRTVRLKEVIEQGLPSPYFKFTYTDSGYISDITFADGLFVYALSYKNQRINKMVNTKSNEVLTYYYMAGNVSYVTLDNATGKKLRSYKINYNNNRQLTQVYWYVFANDIQDSLLERKVLLQYDANGNLVKNEDYRINANAEFELSSVTQYADYDNRINADNLYLLKDFMGHFLYLPQVKLQKIIRI